MITVYIKNRSTAISEAMLQTALPALQKQVSRDFAPAWGIDAKLVQLAAHDPVPPGGWLLVLLDDADQAGALGYHDLTPAGAPMGKVFARTTLEAGGLWTVTCSHELLELLADPNINLVAFDERHHRLYAYEVCDAVEADELAYEIDGVMVSDFVLPGWFEPTHVAPGERFAFRSDVRRPFSLLPGGYIGIYDLRHRRWDQLMARSDRGRMEKHSRIRRRILPPETWLRSTAE